VVKRDINFCTSVVLDFLRKLIEQHPAPPPMETPKPEERPPTTTDLVQTGKKNRKRKEKNGSLLLRREETEEAEEEPRGTNTAQPGPAGVPADILIVCREMWPDKLKPELIPCAIQPMQIPNDVSITASLCYGNFLYHYLAEEWRIFTVVIGWIYRYLNADSYTVINFGLRLCFHFLRISQLSVAISVFSVRVVMSMLFGNLNRLLMWGMRTGCLLEWERDAPSKTLRRGMEGRILEIWAVARGMKIWCDIMEKKIDGDSTVDCCGDVQQSPVEEETKRFIVAVKESFDKHIGKPDKELPSEMAEAIDMLLEAGHTKPFEIFNNRMQKFMLPHLDRTTVCTNVHLVLWYFRLNSLLDELSTSIAVSGLDLLKTWNKKLAEEKIHNAVHKSSGRKLPPFDRLVPNLESEDACDDYMKKRHVRYNIDERLQQEHEMLRVVNQAVNENYQFCLRIWWRTGAKFKYGDKKLPNLTPDAFDTALQPLLLRHKHLLASAFGFTFFLGMFVDGLSEIYLVP